jgi:hypothetical protein
MFIYVFDWMLDNLAVVYESPKAQHVLCTE